MPSLTDLFSPTFFMFLGIVLLVLALLCAYYESKLREQNHKLTSMLSLVSSLAEELNGVKYVLHQVTLSGGSAANIVPFHKNVDLEENTQNKVAQNLIEVSDDDSDENSDDENSDDESNSEIEMYTDDDDTDIDEDQRGDDNNIIDLGHTHDINMIELNNEPEVKIFKINTFVDRIEENTSINEDNFDDMPDLESVSTGSNSSELNEPLDLNFQKSILLNNDNENENNSQYFIAEPKELEENIDLNDIRKINVNDLEDVKSINAIDSNDYKKMSVQRLRSLVVERNLVTDSSKLKKPDLLKLLEDE
jgi:hypothetical protein